MAKANILIVEDDIISAEALRDRLMNMGYNVPQPLATGEEAIEQAELLKPDLVLMDIKLAGSIDGIEAATQIKDKLNIPCIYITAFSDEKILKRAKISAPYNYVVKPVKERELNIVIEIALYKHQLEQELKNTQLQLIQISKMSTLEEMLNGLGHEFGQPLESISLVAELFSHLKSINKLGDAELEKGINDIKMSIKRISHIMELFRLFTRQGPLTFQSIKVDRLLNDTLGLINESLRFKDINIINKVADNLPPIEVEPYQIEQALLNLILNARDTLEEKAEKIRNGALKITDFKKQIIITTSFLTEEGNIFISVKDNGMGIPEIIRDKIFEPFFTTKNNGHATGLGLAICYGIINNHGGKIIVESQVGQETNFKIILPVKKQLSSNSCITKKACP